MSFSISNKIFISVLVVFTISYSLTAAEDSLSWKLLGKQGAPKAVYSSKKHVLAKRLANGGQNFSSSGAESETPRQYGSSYNGGGSYDIYTLIAVSAFAALFGALFFELATGGSLRSMDSGSFNLPFGLSVDSEQITQLVSKITDMVSNGEWPDLANLTDSAVKSRTVRAVADQTGVSKWIVAYKRDPIEYLCIRKVACETLAESALVAKSMKSPFGGVVLSTVGFFIENGQQLQSIVQDTVGNPERCRDMAPWGFCDENEDSDDIKDNK